jgi:hypothetical protein
MPKFRAEQFKDIDILTHAEGDSRYTDKGNYASATAPTQPTDGQSW